MSQSRFFYRFVLLSGFAGWVCCACTPVGSRETIPNERSPLSGSLEPKLPKESDLSQDKMASSSQSLDIAETQATATGVLSRSVAYREGINLASSAYSLSQSAVSPDDWSLIASRWQRASDQLKTVSVEDDHYETAQQKVIEYARNADHAIAQLQALQRSVQTPPSARRSIASVQTNVRPSTAANSIAASATTSSGSTAKVVQVPVIRRLNGTPVIRVTFNGERSYDMILDTGASRTLITRQMANELGVVAIEKMVAATASENKVTFDIGQLSSISIEEITLRDARVSIGDAIAIGLLGNDFLYGYDMTIRTNTVELAAAE